MGNWIDAIVGFVSPMAGCSREAWRQNLNQMRNYDAGDTGRMNSNWRVTNESAEMTDRLSRDNVRARARDLERNSDMANGVLGAYKRNVIGSGYGLQARTHDKELNKKIEKCWKSWCKKKNCDVTETQCLNQMMRMAIERKKVDGGMLFHKAYTTGGIVPFKLQCLEVDEIDISQLVPRNLKNKVVGGIEYNEYNKAEGYWIRQYGIDGFSVHNPVYIDAKDIIYYFSKKRPSQLREISDLSQTITRIRDANEFMNAVSVKERIMACLSVFIKKQFPGTDGAIGRMNAKTEDKYNYNGKTLTPGMINYLNPGDDVETINPSGQSTDAAGYLKVQQRLISAGQGISYEAASRDMSGSTYSSARQNIIEDEMTYADDKELIVEVLDEIYETFLISGCLCGLFKIPDFWENKENYMCHEWIQAPKRWIDPAKEANANKVALQTLQKTFKQIAAENGRDWEEQLDDIMEVLEYGKERGVELGGMLFGQAKKGDESAGDADGKTTGTKKPDKPVNQGF